MPDINILTHQSAFKGRAGQGALPRYRKRGEQEYVFAARLKKAPFWLVVSSDWWGMMEDKLFRYDYIPSNDEARKIQRDPDDKK